MKGMHPLLEKGLLFLRSEIFKPLFLETGAGSSGFRFAENRPPNLTTAIHFIGFQALPRHPHETGFPPNARVGSHSLAM
jgi:hypothetical protein